MSAWLNKLLGKQQTAPPQDGGKPVPSREVVREIEKGVALSQAGKHRMAMQFYDRALALDPSRGDAWSNKGWAHQECGEIPESIACLNKSLELEPECGTTWHNLGLSLKKQKNTEAAMSAFRKAVGATSGIDAIIRARALANLGGLEMESEQYNNALVSLRRAAQLDPSLPLAKFYLAQTLLRTDNESEAKLVILSMNDSRLRGEWSEDETGSIKAAIYSGDKPLYRYMRSCKDEASG